MKCTREEIISRLLKMWEAGGGGVAVVKKSSSQEKQICGSCLRKIFLIYFSPAKKKIN